MVKTDYLFFLGYIYTHEYDCLQNSEWEEQWSPTVYWILYFCLEYLEGAFNINLCGHCAFVTCVALVCEEDCILMD